MGCLELPMPLEQYQQWIGCKWIPTSCSNASLYKSACYASHFFMREVLQHLKHKLAAIVGQARPKGQG